MNNKTMDNICTAPWQHCSIASNGDVFLCCHSSYLNRPLGNLYSSSLHEIWNNEAYQNIRRQFMAGIVPTSCKSCFSKNTINGFGLKAYLRNYYPIDTLTLNNTVSFSMLRTLDVRFSNLCQGKCLICQTAYPHNENVVPENLSEDISEQLFALTPQLIDLYFAGGEPLLAKEHHQWINQILEEGRHDICLRYNSNFIEGQKFLDAWKQFNKVNLSISLDGFNARGELIRKGINYTETISNIINIQKACPNIQVDICCTVSIYNIDHIPEFVLHLIQTLPVVKRNQIYFNLLQNPPWLSIQILPTSKKKLILSQYLNLIDLLQNNDNDQSQLIGQIKMIILYLIGSDNSHLWQAFQKIFLSLSKNEQELFPLLTESPQL